MHSLPALTLVHLRLIARHAGFGAAVLTVAAVLIPLWILVADLPAVPSTRDIPSLPGHWWPVMVVIGGFVPLSLLFAFLWPETVWRRLGPGERSELDALPVPRQRNRCARLLAGAALPAILGVSIAVSVLMLGSRRVDALVGVSEGADPGSVGVLISGAPLALLVAYALGSILALRLGRVLLPLVAIVLVVIGLPALLVSLGVEWLRGVTEVIALHPYSPVQALAYGGWSGRVVPGLFWLVVFGGGAGILAGRHDYE